MRNKVKVVVSFFCVLCLAFGMTACKKQETVTESEYSIWVDDGNNNASGDNDNNTDASKDSSSKNNSSKKNNNKNNDGGVLDQIIASIPKNLRGSTVEIFTWNDMKQIDGVKKVVSNFQKASGITVKWTAVGYNDYDTLLNSRMAAGNAPDIVQNNQVVLSRMKHYQPVDGIGYNFSDSEWDSQTMKEYTVKGKPYAVMLNYKNTLFQQPQVLFYNKDLISKYDFSDPYKLWKQGKWDMNTMLDMCKSFKNETGKAAWSIGSPWEWIRWNKMAGPFGFDGTTVTNNLRNQALITSYQQLCDYKTSGYLSETNLDVGSFNKGELLFVGYNMANDRTANSTFSEMKSKGSLGLVPLPIGNNTVIGEYESYSFPKGAKNTAAAPYFLRYYLDKNNYNQNTFFASNNAIEIYEWCMQQTRIGNTINLMGNSGSGTKVEQLGSKVWTATSATVSTEIAKSASELDAEAKKLNETIGDFS